MAEISREKALDEVRKLILQRKGLEFVEDAIAISVRERRMLGKIKQEREAVQGEVESLKPVLTSLKERIKFAEQASEVAEKKADKLQSENKRAAGKLAAGLKEEAAAEMKALNDMHAERVGSCNSEIAALKMERDRISAEVDKFRKSLQRLRAQLGQVA